MTAPDAEESDALTHLGQILYILADLAPDERCRALDNALQFYNQQRPDAQIEPSGVWTTYLVQVHSFAGPGVIRKEIKA